MFFLHIGESEAYLFTDARGLPDGERLQAEVCIVGAGAAGIVLAREFANAPFRVLLLESGALTFKHRSQFLYRAESRGRPYPAVEFTKRRQFGGSTVTWFGRCRPLDELDFEARPWLPHSGWPFSKSHLDPYFDRAGAYCQLPPEGFDPPAEYFKSDRIETRKFLFSPPTDFGRTYGPGLAQSANIHVVLNANAVHIGLDEQGGNVDRLLCKTLTGKSFSVQARLFLLAASALENTRLLLVSRDVHPNGIGNQHDLLGRFFMEHPHIFSGSVTALPPDLPRDFLKLNYDSMQKNLGQANAIGLTRDVMEKERLLNGSAFLVDRPLYKTIDAYYSNAALHLAGVTEMLQHSKPPGLTVFGDLARALRHPGTLGRLLAAAAFGRLQRRRRLTLRLQLETAPNPDSRVTLSSDTDALGTPKLALEWRTTGLDIDSLRRFEDHLYAGLHQAGFQAARFRHDLSEDGWPVSMRSAKHHMGTTRMHTDPRLGVVDADCRVHQVSNLYIAGSSVFPTCGMANPTLTILALAIRLADHIKRELDA